MDHSWFHLYCLSFLLASHVGMHGNFWMKAIQQILEKIVSFSWKNVFSFWMEVQVGEEIIKMQ